MNNIGLGTTKDTDFIQKLTEIVLANLRDESFGVEELVNASGLSHGTLLHKLKSISQKNINQFICEIRLRKAKEILENDSMTAAEVAYAVGFGSPAYFTSCFHEYFGYTPGEVRKKITHTSEIPSSQPDINSGKKDSFKKLLVKRRSLFIHLSQLIVTMIIIWLVYMAFFSNTKIVFTGKNESNKSIAVLPFKNLSSDENNRYFADGIMEDIINQLNKISRLKVTPRTSSEHFRESIKSIPEIAKELGVDYILEGSIRKDENNIKITVQLIDVKNDSHIFSETYERKPEDIFVIQSSIAKQVAEKLELTLTSDEISKIEKIPTNYPQAHNYYLLGRYFWNQRTKEGVFKSVEYFSKAVETDPEYAVALAGLADGYFILTWYDWYVPKKEGYAKAKKYAIDAIKLDDELAEAYTVLGGVLTWDDWNWEEARKTFKHAIELNPNHSVTHQYYAELLHILDEKTEARSEINQAIDLDPVSFIHRIISYLGYYYEEKFNESLLECEKTQEINPNYRSVYLTLFHIQIALGNDSLAVEAIKKWISRDTTMIKEILPVHEIYRQTGMQGVIKCMIEREKSKIKPNALNISNLYCLLGEKENALTWLEIAFNNRPSEIPRINVNPDFDILRAEPRFLKIIDEMGLTKYHKRKPNAQPLLLTVNQFY